MEREAVKQELIQILQGKFHLPPEVFSDASMDTSLCRKPFRLGAIELVYLLYETEAHFHITISETLLEQIGFRSIDQITEVVLRSA